MTKKIDASPHHEEQEELGHSFSVLRTLSYNVSSNVAEAYNGDNDANCQQFEASKDGPYNWESGAEQNNVCFIRLTEHTMDKLCFKYVWKQDAET